MHPLIRFAVALIFLFLAALSVLAGPKSSRPVDVILLHPWQIEEIDKMLPDSGSVKIQDEKSVNAVANRKTLEGRICSCQVLNLISSNYDHRYVVLLAEKKNDEGGAGFRDAKKRLQK